MSKEVNAVSAKTLSNYHWRLRQFLALYGNTAPQELRKAHLHRLILDLRLEGELSESSVNAVVQGVKAFCLWLHEEGHIAKPLHDAIKRNKPKERPKSRPTTAEAAGIMLARAETKRDKAIMMFLCDTGARRGEVANLKISNIDFDKHIAIVNGKVGERPVTFTTPTEVAVLDYIQNERPNVTHDYAFCNYQPPHGRVIGQSIYNLCRDLGRGLDARINPHAFRHWVCNEYAHNGGLDVAQHKMGHHSIVTTMSYVHTNIQYVQEHDEELTVLNYLE